MISFIVGEQALVDNLKVALSRFSTGVTAHISAAQRSIPVLGFGGRLW
jgi:hypothetical protein